jgi:hypothetical protein
VTALGATAGRVGAMLSRHYYLFRGSWTRVFDLMYWPLLQMVVWGFITVFLNQHSSFFAQAAGVLSRAGIAIGAIEASTITIITLKVTAPVLFDETPVGLRRRRTMVEGLQRLEALADDLALPAGEAAPTLDVIAAVTLFDYQQMRYGDQPWLPVTPRLRALAEAWRARPSMAKTMPYMA